MKVSTKDELLQELAHEETRLADLDRQCEAARSRIEALRADLAAVRAAESTRAVLPVVASVQAPPTPAEKVRLFRALFRGREDIFPTRFVSQKTGNSGYAPACANKFVRGVCELPKVKCGECPNQAFTPVEDQVVLDHLRGRHVMGIYPLLEDETCWLLAADFDRASWQDDVGAFVETSQAIGVPVAVERSRSGNGAHAWFFFATPVVASIARKMGCYLLTETMTRRHQLSMRSYDRLFPNQDTMPRGGFGNLIALPLQREPRQHGNSVFVDGRFQAYPDQWAFLASVPRIASSTVEAIAKEATRRGLVIGVRGEAASVRVKGEHVILEFLSRDEDGDWEDDGSGWLSSLIPLRADLAAGDLRALYLAWLLCVESGELEDDVIEPPVPAGLGDLTAPLEAFADFLRIDGDLIAVAAARSPKAEAPFSERELEQWIAALPDATKTDWLVRLAEGKGPHLHAELLRLFRESRPSLPQRRTEPPRTVGELLAAVERRAEERRRKEAKRAAAEQARREREAAEARERYLADLGEREAAAWRMVDQLIATKQPARYDEAVALLCDLRELALRRGSTDEVEAHLRRLCGEHFRKPTFMQRLRKAGLA